ncbi:hypothetical protein [Hyphomicrobium sp. LHD-15]|uniref:hypothetical protein n=1 Tax=Hyphomicrobium sp. LHD-15 TaxID=3072142 RepID=UPI0028109A60|nr:hypothetical protein [Hyphomicrobium sp. LHD-15]MDQ8697195.1 hypothetical protein [Hyphomicrobium sp. LHD-15]
MLARTTSAVVAASMLLTTLPPPAVAQFGIKRAFKKVVRAPTRIVPGVGVGVAGVGVPLVVFGGPFRSAFGVVAAVAIGTVIFNHLSKSERREVAQRAKTVVAKDPEQRVTDTYTSKDGKKQVTIVAEPMQKASDLKNDPAILMVADTVVKPDSKAGNTPGTNLASDTSKATDAGPQTTPPAGAAAATTAAPAAKPVADEEVVRINAIPPDTQCRKVTTELELRKKKGQETADEKSANTAIFCQTAPGEWKPASA